MGDAAEFVGEHLDDHDRLLEAMGTPRFWSVALAGQLGGSEVEEVSVEPVGTGQVASCLRVALAHGQPQAPRSVVVKTASSDPVSRATSAALRTSTVFAATCAPAWRSSASVCSSNCACTSARTT